MRSALYNLLFLSLTAWAITGCVGESAPPGDEFIQNGAAVDPDGQDATERDTALTVFELGVDQAFPSAAGAPDGQIHANSCVNVRCSRPNLRCTGGCAGYVCSRTDGGMGTCELPGGGGPPQPRPRPTPNSQSQD